MCSKCNIPIYTDTCPCCKNKGKYVSTDLRPVFPKEKLLLGIILKKETPFYFDNSSVWCSNNFYIVDGEKLVISITELNDLPLEEIIKIKENMISMLMISILLILMQ